MAGILGIVGGLGPEATVYYYRLAVRLYRERWGVAPRLVVYSLPLEEMCRAAKSGDVEGVARLLLEALRGLAGAGAGVALVSANTPHMAWDRVVGAAEELGVRLVSIFDPIAEEAARRGYRRVGLLATGATLRAGFYQRALRARGVEALEPPGDVQERVDEAIEELAMRGPEARGGALPVLAGAVEALAAGGAEAVVVACTDISPYLPDLQAGSPVPLLDSSVEHVRAALELLGGPQ